MKLRIVVPAAALMGVAGVSCSTASPAHVASVVPQSVSYALTLPTPPLPVRVALRPTTTLHPRDYNTPKDEQALAACGSKMLTVRPTQQRPIHTRQEVVALDMLPPDRSVVLNGVVFGVVSHATSDQTSGPNTTYNFKDVVAWVVLTTRWIVPVGPPGSSHTAVRERWYSVYADKGSWQQIGSTCDNPP
jgi:hypothetical protein